MSLKIKFFILTFFCFSQVFSNNTCKKCDLEKVKIASEHLDSLTFQIVKDFLCTFDSSCKQNVEYSEWSNEILFRVIEKSPSLFLKAAETSSINKNEIIAQVKSPILDFDIQKIYDKLKLVSAPKNLKTEYLQALVKAAQHSGQRISE